MSDSNSDKNIGAITEVDGVDIDDVDKDLRREWAGKLVSKIENMTGVDDVGIEDANKWFTSVRLFIEMQATQTGSQYNLKVDPRSFSQKLRHLLDDDLYVSANLMDSEIEGPDPVEHGEGYQNKYYFVEVYYP